MIKYLFKEMVMENNYLDELADKYGTDKKILCHGYTRVYDKFFGPIKNEVKNLIEVGIFDGASVKMWQEYFKNANIMALDISQNSVDSVKDIDRVTSLLQNATDGSFWKSLPFKADIIIDDGSHVVEEQESMLLAAWDSLLPGGYYIIEDTHSSFHNVYKQDRSKQYGFYNTVFNRILSQQSYETLQGDWYQVREKFKNRIDKISYETFGIYSFTSVVIIEKCK
jgi:hypothetical protein